MRQVSRRWWGAFELDHPTDRREYGARGDDAGRPLQAAERFFEVGYLLGPGAIGGTGELNFHHQNALGIEARGPGVHAPQALHHQAGAND